MLLTSEDVTRCIAALEFTCAALENDKQLDVRQRGQTIREMRVTMRKLERNLGEALGDAKAVPKLISQ